VLRAGSDDDLFHVEIGRVQKTAAARRGQHRKRIRRAGRAEIRALQRIDRDIHLRQTRVPFRRLADLLADEQHRRLVALAFADDDRSVDRHFVERPSHGLDRRAVRRVPVPLAHRLRAGDAGLLDHAKQFEREIDAKIVHARPPNGGSSQRVGLSVR
jgi:hypothetical protein